MARNRVIYQSEGLIDSSVAASTAAVDHEQLERVQSANYSYTINRQDVNQYGELARIDSIVLDPPTVSVDFSYLLTDGFNERVLGFFVHNSGGINGGTIGINEGNFASGHLVAHSGQNVFIVTSPDGIDLNKGEAIDSADTVIGVGNCYISDYSVDLSVGSLPTVSVTMEGANMNAQTGGGELASPAISQDNGDALTNTIAALPAPVSTPGGTTNSSTITALRPGDVTVNFGNVAGETIADLTGDGTAHVQSVAISLPLSRTPLSRLGTKFPFARTVDFPVTPTISLSAIMDSTHASNLADVLDSGVQNVNIGIKDSNGIEAVRYTLKGVKIDSESYSSSIGANKSVDLTFSATVGGPSDTSAGVFMSGANGNNVYIA